MECTVVIAGSSFKWPPLINQMARYFVGAAEKTPIVRLALKYGY